MRRSRLTSIAEKTNFYIPVFSEYFKQNSPKKRPVYFSAGKQAYPKFQIIWEYNFYMAFMPKHGKSFPSGIRRDIPETGEHLRIGIAQMLGNRPDFIHYSHEGGIPVPAGHQMKMQMLPYAGARGFAEIQADIYALTMKMFFEDNDAFLEHTHHFRGFRRRQIFESHYMPVRTDHNVAIIVWKFVHYNEALAATI